MQGAPQPAPSLPQAPGHGTAEALATTAILTFLWLHIWKSDFSTGFHKHARGSLPTFPDGRYTSAEPTAPGFAPRGRPCGCDVSTRLGEQGLAEGHPAWPVTFQTARRGQPTHTEVTALLNHVSAWQSRRLPARGRTCVRAPLLLINDPPSRPWGKHRVGNTREYTAALLQSCAPAMYITLLTEVTQYTSFFKKKLKSKFKKEEDEENSQNAAPCLLEGLALDVREARRDQALGLRLPLFVRKSHSPGQPCQTLPQPFPKGKGGDLGGWEHLLFQALSGQAYT